jgi:hypothetical protein
LARKVAATTQDLRAKNFENSGIDLDQMMVRILRTSTAEALEGAATIVVGFVIVRMIRMAPR